MPRSITAWAFLFLLCSNVLIRSGRHGHKPNFFFGQAFNVVGKVVCPAENQDDRWPALE